MPRGFYVLERAGIPETLLLPQGELWRRSVQVLRALAAANAAIASQDWPRALEALQRAGAFAEAMKLGRMRIEIMALRAYALDRNADDGRPLLEEAMNLAETYDLTRLFVDGALRAVSSMGPHPLSNKEIALAMEVGEEPVKWHLKNLFGKLSAGNRKHVVRRAHLLGLLEEAR